MKANPSRRPDGMAFDDRPGNGVAHHRETTQLDGPSRISPPRAWSTIRADQSNQCGKSVPAVAARPQWRTGIEAAFETILEKTGVFLP